MINVIENSQIYELFMHFVASFNWNLFHILHFAIN
jgi:hypothetical protein